MFPASMFPASMFPASMTILPIISHLGFLPQLKCLLISFMSLYTCNKYKDPEIR